MNSPAMKLGQARGLDITLPGRTEPNFPKLVSNWPERENVPMPLIAGLLNGERYVLITGEFYSIPSLLIYPLPDPLNEKPSLFVAMRDGETADKDTHMTELFEAAKIHMQLGDLMTSRGYWDYAFWCYQRGIEAAKISTEVTRSVHQRENVITNYIEYLRHFAKIIFERIESDPSYQGGDKLGSSLMIEAREVLYQEGLHEKLGILQNIDNLKDTFEALSPKNSNQVCVSAPALPEMPAAELIQTDFGHELAPQAYYLRMPDQLLSELPLLLRGIQRLNELEEKFASSKLVVGDNIEPFYLLKFKLGVGFLMAHGYPTGEYPYSDRTLTQFVREQIEDRPSDTLAIEVPQETLAALYDEHLLFFRRANCAMAAKDAQQCGEDLDSAFDALKLVFEYGDERHQDEAIKLACVTVVQTSVDYAASFVETGNYIEAAKVLVNLVADVNNIANVFDVTDDPAALVAQAHAMREERVIEMLKATIPGEHRIQIAKGILKLCDTWIHQRFEEIPLVEAELRALMPASIS